MTGFLYGEVCAGVGGMSRGLEAGGFTPAFHAEIAPFPRRVLAHHWPDTPLLSDLIAVSGGRKMGAWMRRHFSGLTLLAGGTPCQDLSVAGKRAGIMGERSSLYFRFVRLWKLLGCPYILWENVAGALSSNRGADFSAVLSAIVGGTVPVPSQGWSRGGVVAGPTGVAAWRLLDAQWFGVPQRRLRVFVLGARAGGVDPAEVLLEPQGVRRHPPTRREAGERVADSLTVGANQTCGFPGDDVSGEEGSSVGFHVCGDGSDYGAECRTTLRAQEHSFGGRPAAVLSFGWQNSESQGDDVSQGSDAPLRTGTTPAVLAFDQHNQDDTGEVVSTVRTNGQNSGAPVVLAYDTTQVTSKANRSNPRARDTDHALAAGAHAPLVVPTQEVGKRTGVSTTDTRCGLGIGDDGDPMYTLQAGAQHGVVSVTGDITHALTHEGHDASENGTGHGTPIVAYFDKQRLGEYGENGVASTDSARDYKDATDLILGLNNGSRLDSAATVSAAASDARAMCLLRLADGAEAVQWATRGLGRVRSPEVLRCEVHGCGLRRQASEGRSVMDDSAPPRAEALSTGAVCALREAANGGASQGRELAEQCAGESGTPLPGLSHQASSVGVPRRLMPVETERLMGWSDGWTNVPDPKTGKSASDAQRYKACGNGVVSPVAEWIASRLLAVHTAMLDGSQDEQREVAA